MSEHTPVTVEEAEYLQKLGWRCEPVCEASADLGWWWVPSMGPAVRVQDDPKYMRIWLEDLAVFRRQEMLQSLADKALTLLGYQTYGETHGSIGFTQLQTTWEAIRDLRAAVLKAKGQPQ